MRLMFWKPEETPVPAPSGDCRHLWSNWSEPEGIRGESYTPYSVRLEQQRRCLHCNLVQRSVT